MSLQRPLIIGGGVALILWLLTKESDAAKEADQKDSEKAERDGGAVEAAVRGGDNGSLVDVGFTIEDEATGECKEAVDAAGNTISCLEFDKRLRESMQAGGVGAEANI